jgi:hypothetical protein
LPPRAANVSPEIIKRLAEQHLLTREAAHVQAALI